MLLLIHFFLLPCNPEVLHHLVCVALGDMRGSFSAHFVAVRVVLASSIRGKIQGEGEFLRGVHSLIPSPGVDFFSLLLIFAGYIFYFIKEGRCFLSS